MSFKQMLSIPKVLKAILLGFLGLIAIRVTWPIANIILGLFTDNTIMKVAAILIFWLITLFVLWFLPWAEILKPNTKEGGQ